MAFIVLSALILPFYSTIPLIGCNNPLIEIGPKIGATSTVTADFFYQEMSNRVVDCWKMYGSGRYATLKGKTPPNPRVCFIVQFNLKENISINGLVNYMKTTDYSNTNMSYYDYLFGSLSTKGASMIVPGIGDKASKEINNGTIYIAYADTGSDEWGSAPCNVFSKPGIASSKLDRIFICYDSLTLDPGEILVWGKRCQVPLYQEDCCRTKGTAYTWHLEKCFSLEDVEKEMVCEEILRNKEGYTYDVKLSHSTINGKTKNITRDDCEAEGYPKGVGICYNSGAPGCDIPFWSEAQCLTDSFCDEPRGIDKASKIYEPTEWVLSFYNETSQNFEYVEIGRDMPGVNWDCLNIGLDRSDCI